MLVVTKVYEGRECCQIRLPASEEQSHLLGKLVDDIHHEPHFSVRIEFASE